MTRTGRDTNEAGTPLRTVAFNYHGLKGSLNCNLLWLSDIDVMFLSETMMRLSEMSYFNAQFKYVPARWPNGYSAGQSDICPRCTGSKPVAD